MPLRVQYNPVRPPPHTLGSHAWQLDPGPWGDGEHTDPGWSGQGGIQDLVGPSHI